MNPNAALIIAPVVLPMMAAAVLLLIRDSRRLRGSLVNIFASCAGLVAAVAILWHVNHATGPDAVAVHLTSNWAAPFGIALVADRLSALMLVVVGIVGVGTSLYAAAGWSRTGSYFHPLFQILLMGINGAFLTGDLFNLFVFFEVLLAASFALLLHGSGKARIKAALHYISINVATSLLFLIGAATIYGVTGTLNMADLAVRIPAIGGSDLAILQSGMAILGIAFLVKAGMWPLGFWLPSTYATASPPVAALFTILSKVGIYAVLRVLLLLPQEGLDRNPIS